MWFDIFIKVVQLNYTNLQKSTELHSTSNWILLKGWSRYTYRRDRISSHGKSAISLRIAVLKSKKIVPVIVWPDPYVLAWKGAATSSEGETSCGALQGLGGPSAVLPLLVLVIAGFEERANLMKVKNMSDSVIDNQS